MGVFSKRNTCFPHSLTEPNKLNRVSTAIPLLLRHKNVSVLNRIVTGNEKLISYGNFWRRRSWKLAWACAEPVVNVRLHPMKLLLSLWWDMRGKMWESSSRRNNNLEKLLHQFQYEYASKDGRYWQMGTVSFCTRITQEHMLQNRPKKCLKN